ncbi:polymorphic toxin-type HINT domain-containing protein [Streptomyces lavendofoliae]|uniref:polymorphic toxin-type HINT domain-containing protein n=1 Tax=Streptomyces lavendofoliae TaxID=67314 RepID=UPI003D921F65
MPTSAAPAATTDRGRVLRFWKIGGPGVKAAAEVALAGTDGDVQRFLAEVSTTNRQDDRVAAAQVASVGGANTIEAARRALSGSPEALRAFLDFGWRAPLEQDERVRVAQVMDGAGPGVVEAGRAALNGTPGDIRKFLTEGQYAQREQDERVQVAQILSTGGAAVRAAGQLALKGTPADIREFLEVGQHVARSRDQEYLTVAQLAALAKEAGRQAAVETAAAKETSKRAVEASKLAKEAALRAADEAEKTKNDANKAAGAAARAATAAGQAAAAAQKAIDSARAANSSARVAANAAAQAAAAAAGAAKAASRARGAAAAAATDAGNAAAARKAADDADAAAKGAEDGAAAAAQAEIAANAAGDAALAAAGAGLNAAAAADAAVQASSYANQSDARAAQARAAAAQARRHADEASRAANAAVALARKAAKAAGEARAAATSAAKHAREAAKAARESAQFAGEAATAAAKSTAHAKAAQQAADEATAYVEKATATFAIAREVEAAEILARTNAGIERARDLKEREQAGKAEQSDVAKKAQERAAEAQRLAAEAGVPGADTQAVVGKGRRLAVLTMQDGGPWSRAAAQAAVAGADADVLDYVRTRWKEAAEQDARDRVALISTDSPLKEVRDAADEALKGDAATVSAFLAAGQYQAGLQEYRVRTAQIISGGGPVLQEAGRAALANNTLEGYREFLGEGQHTARNQDERVRAAQLIAAGGDEVKSGARIALEGPADLLHEFIQSGQYTAQRKDMLTSAHVAQVQKLIAESARTAALAQQDAAEANRVAALARKASKEADAYAKAAKASAASAKNYAADAEKSAKAAEASAAQAAASAKTAREAAASAQRSATEAAASAADATLSSEMAHASAATAWAEADRARAFATAAGKDAKAALEASKSAFATAAAKLKAEAEQQRNELRRQHNETGFQRMQRCGLLDCPPENDPFHCDKKPPSDPFCLSLAMSKKVAPYAEAMFELGKSIAGLDQLEECMDYDLWACTELMRDVTISSKLRMLKGAYETLRAVERIIVCETCFLAGTKVLMADGGKRNIEQIRLGENVLATDPVSGRTEPRKVTRLIVTEHDKHFNRLTIRTRQGNAKLTATYEHPFWSPSKKQWIRAADLRPGMTLLSSDGTTVAVTANHAYSRQARTYNLTVDDLHTYYVLAGRTPVLVHNAGCKHVALGRTETPDNPFSLEEFAMEHGADMYKHWPDGKQWYNHVKDFLAKGSTARISFNLDGIDDPVGAAARGKSVDPANDFEGLTDWELHQISESRDAWDRITWYKGGKKVDNPFKK